MPPKRIQKKIVTCLVTGEEGCGKTSLVQRFIDDTYVDEYNPTEFMGKHKKTVNMGGNDIVVALSDTDGQKKYENYSINYYGQQDVIMIVYDVSNQRSLICIKDVYETIESRTSGDIKPVVAIVASKMDLSSKINLEDVQSFAEHNEMLHFETCAKTGSTVNDMFTFLIKKICKKKYDMNFETDKDTVKAKDTANQIPERRYSSIEPPQVKNTSKENSTCTCSIS